MMHTLPGPAYTVHGGFARMRTTSSSWRVAQTVGRSGEALSLSA